MLTLSRLLNIQVVFENMNNYFRDSASDVGALADKSVIIPIIYIIPINNINI